MVIIVFSIGQILDKNTSIVQLKFLVEGELMWLTALYTKRVMRQISPTSLAQPKSD